VFFLILGLYGLIQSLVFGPWEAVALPAAVSGVIVLMASVEVVKEVRTREPAAAEPKDPLERAKTRETRLRLVLIIAWTAALMLGIYLFGFRIAIPIFAFSYLKWRGWGWIASGLFAGAMIGFTYGAFDIGLKAPLFEGIVFGGR
jgi:hypothetical protein